MRIAFGLLASVLILAIASRSLWADGSRLVVGDLVEVRVDGEKDLSNVYQIDNEGNISLPMVDRVKVIGMNTSDAAAAVTLALAKVLVNPEVTIRFLERAKMQVFVVGRVKQPGLITIGVGDRVMQALAQAGYDDTADLTRVSVRRDNEITDVDLTKYLKGEDLNVNIELQSGDTVVVPQKNLDVIGTVLLVGQVERAGEMSVRQGMTLREAISVAGGVTVDADTEGITVKRVGMAEPMRVDYARAMAGDPSADIVLQPGDAIYVPQVENAFFTVIGAVGRPNQYPLKGSIRLSEAIGLAGGATPGTGDLRKVTILRGKTDQQPGEKVNVDLTKVIYGSADDPLIQRGDVIFVKHRKQRLSTIQMISSAFSLGWLLKQMGWID